MLRSFETVDKLTAEEQKLFEDGNRIVSKYT